MIQEQSLKIMEQCPRFSGCSVPICPLDYYQDLKVKEPGDDKCGVAKSIRIRIGKDTGLLYNGLTKKEFIGKQQWEQKTELEKNKFIAFGRENLERIRDMQSCSVSASQF
jgi:hypothetical protein